MRKLKIEFKRRLIRLGRAINESVERDSITGDLIPALFAVYTFMWCKKPSDFVNFKKLRDHE